MYDVVVSVVERPVPLDVNIGRRHVVMFNPCFWDLSISDDTMLFSLHVLGVRHIVDAYLIFLVCRVSQK